MKRFPQAVTPATDQRTGALDVPGQPRQVVTPYLDSREAVAYLKLPSLSSLYSHIRENKLPTLRAGGDLRFDSRDLDAWLRGFGSALEMQRADRTKTRSHVLTVAK